MVTTQHAKHLTVIVHKLQHHLSVHIYETCFCGMCTACNALSKLLLVWHICPTFICNTAIQDVREKLVSERQRMMLELAAVSFLESFPSSANFILCKVINGYEAKDVKIGLAKQGVMVRHYAQRHLSGYIRISVGKPEQTDKLMSALRQL